MSLLNRVTAQIGRPLLMTPGAAQHLAERVRALDPRSLAQRKSLLARPTGFLARLSELGRRRAMEDDEVGGEAQPAGPSCYAPLYAREPMDEGFGWSLVEGVATMSIDGPLLDRGYEFCGWHHGYDTISAALREANAHPDVKAIFLRVDSPGGVVAGGLPALAAEMRAMRGGAGGKPIWVYADMACSAAYWIAAQADRIVSPAVGLVGSIGAVIVHEDYSAALEKAGVKVTAIQFGANKTDGANWKALDEHTIATLQAEINQCGQLFVADVALGRPVMTVAKQIETQASVYMAQHADAALSGVAIGLVDAIASEETAFRALQAVVGLDALYPSAQEVRAPAAARGGARKSGASSSTEQDMSIQAKLKAFFARTGKGRTALTEKEQLDEVRKIVNEPADDAAEEAEEEVAPPAEGAEPPVAEGDDPPAEGEEDEEEKKDTPAAHAAARVSALVSSPEAKGREKLAAKLASSVASGALSVKAAKEALAASPRESRLAGVPDPNLGGGDGGRQPRKSSLVADAEKRAGAKA